MKNKLLTDAALIAGLLLLSAAVFFALPRGGEGREVCVTLDGEEFATLSLYDDAVVDIGGRCTLSVKNGEASVTEAVCRDGICLRHRPIKRAGESIVCLPSRVTVKITGGTDFVI